MHSFPAGFVVLQLSTLAWAMMEIWIFSRDRRAVRGRREDRGSLRLLIVAIAASIWLGYGAAFSLPALRIRGGQPALFFVGAALIWASMALRLWAVLTLGAFFRTSVTVLEAHRLVTAGPYRWLRHPAYTGSIVTMAGLGLGLGNWASLAVLTAGGLAGFGWRIHVEEAALAAEFGSAWDAYAADRWAVIPFVW